MNSIINNNLEGNNSMKLSFHWLAIFNDGTMLAQIENGVENRFQIVKDRFDDLVGFILHNKDNSSVFVVDLLKGQLKFGPMYSLEGEETKEVKKNIRLIYFRRNQIILSQNGAQMDHIIEYHLGFQYQDEEGKNKQTVIKIDSKGYWILEN